MASHGYLVVSFDFLDGTSFCATDRDGNDVPFGIPLGSGKDKKGNADLNWHKNFKAKQFQRVNECYLLAEEISKKSFAQRELTFDVEIDSNKMIVAGHSLGGWTSILAASGN